MEFSVAWLVGWRWQRFAWAGLLAEGKVPIVSDRLRILEREGRMSTVRFQRRWEGMASRKEHRYIHSVIARRRRWVQTWGSVCLEVGSWESSLLVASAFYVKWEMGWSSVSVVENWGCQKFEKNGTDLEKGGARWLEKSWRIVQWYWEPCWGVVMNLLLICPVVWFSPAGLSILVASIEGEIAHLLFR